MGDTCPCSCPCSSSDLERDKNRRKELQLKSCPRRQRLLSPWWPLHANELSHRWPFLSRSPLLGVPCLFPCAGPILLGLTEITHPICEVPKSRRVPTAAETSGRDPFAREDAGLNQACWHSGHMVALSVLGSSHQASA